MVDEVIGSTAVETPRQGRARLAWTDWLLERCEAVPWPLWLTLVVLTALGVLLTHAVEWWLGPLPVGEFEIYRATVPFYPLGVLASIAVQQRVTRSALRQFRGAVATIDDAEYERIEQDLIHPPPRAALVAGLAVGLLGLAALVSAPDTEARREAYPAAFGADVVLTAITYAFAGPWLIGIFRLIRGVNRLHQRATVIDLFHPGPLHAFSTATATAGVSLMIVVTFSMVAGADSAETSSGLFLSLAATLLAGSAFIVPLWGMHRRLQAERARLAGEASTRIQRVQQQLFDQVDRDAPGGTEAKDRLAALLSLRELIAGLSTWPWQPETPRWLFSALLVPLVIWGTTRLLERAGL